ncbi:MAG: hypothetical protein HYR77_06720 [Ignavibacteria bacterium]|nr:hypothetical protein [Ignavibacteria bacterium]
MIIIRNYMLLIVVCVVAQLCYGQKNPAYKQIQAYTRQPEKLQKLGMNQYQAEWCTYMGYSDTTVKEFVKGGVDLVKAISRPELRDEKDKAALADCIVIGVVMKIDHDSSEVPYHTIAYIKVDRFLRNDFNVNKKEIPVLIRSGPVKGGLRLEAMHEEKLEKGEHVLLFLSATSLLFDAYYSSHSSLAYYKKVIDQSDISFLMSYKYLIDANRAINGKTGKAKELNEIIDEIEYVTRLLRRPPFGTNKDNKQ